MVYFQTKTTNLGSLGWGLQWNIYIYVMDARSSILKPFCIFYGHSEVIWNIFTVLVCCTYQEKSGYRDLYIRGWAV
jgi:hypothetical protein